jgi:hypothetical protein
MHPAGRIAGRIARLVATGVALGWLAYTLSSWFLAWNPADAGAYLQAAERWRSGAPLYAAMSPDAHEVYRYAPWFALAWMPATFLPSSLVEHAWSLAMLVAAGFAVAPLLRPPSRSRIVLAALLGAVLAETAMFGNVHPLVVAALSWSIRRPSGPVWVGITASVKLVPILFVAHWAAIGEWRKAGVALAVAAALLLPMLAFDLSHYTTDPGSGLASVYAASPALWLGVALAAGAISAWLLARRSWLAPIALAALMFLGPPRASTAYLAFLIPGALLALERAPQPRARGDSRQPSRDSDIHAAAAA